MKRIFGHGLLWLMVLILLPFGLLMLAATLFKAAVAGVMIAAIALVIFVVAFLTRNSPAAQMMRPPAKAETPSDD